MTKKISQLNSPTLPLSGSELMEMSQDNTSVQVTVTQLGNVIGYVDRGDPAASDFIVGSLTVDATWRDLDLSSIVPAGAIAVHIGISGKNDSAGVLGRLRKNGNSNETNALLCRPPVANIMEDADGIVSCDSSRFIEYNINDAATWATFNIKIRGWFI